MRFSFDESGVTPSFSFPLCHSLCAARPELARSIPETAREAMHIYMHIHIYIYVYICICIN